MEVSFCKNNLTGCILASGICMCLFGMVWVYSCTHYSFSGSMNPSIQTIAVPIFDDYTSEFQIREKITDRVIESFLKDNNLRIVEQDEADSILRGTIRRVEDIPIALKEDESAREFELQIYVSVVYENAKDKKVIFEETIRGRGTYNEPSERDLGIDEAIDKLAVDILNKVISGW